MHEPIGFMARAPLSEWNKRIGVDYPGVFKAVLKATVAVATANAPGAISAAIDGFFAFKLEDAQRTPEELAWLLTRRALAHAMAELTVEAARRHGTPLQDKKGWSPHSTKHSTARRFGLTLHSLIGRPDTQSSRR